MIIRPITINDAENFLNLCKTIENSRFMLFEPGERKTTVEQQKKSIKNIMAKENSIIFVAEIDQQLVGYIVAIGGELKRNKHSAYLVLGVHDEFQERGIGTSLLSEVFTWAKNVGIKRLGLTVIKDNVKAFHLYRKMGFVIEGEKVHSLLIDDKPVNEYYLYKLL